MNKMKRIFSFVLVFALLVGSFSSFSTLAFAEEVKDVETAAEVLTKVPSDVLGTEYEDAVTRLVAFGVIGGYPDGTYKPEEVINRAQFAKLVVVALGLNDAVPAATNKATGFKDVKPGYWAAGYINVASGQNLLKGYPDGTFKPANQVSYAEALTILVRALGYQDEFLPGKWPGNYVAKAADVNITTGVKLPATAEEGAKRGKVAQLVNNAFDAKVVKVDTYKPNVSEVEYYETDIPLLKDKLEISKYEDTRIIGDKLVDDGLQKDELRVRFLEDIERVNKNSKYDRGEIVKRAYAAGEEDVYVFNNFVNPRAVIGEEVTTYINDNDEVVYIEREYDDKANFDFVEKVKNGNRIELVAFDKDYQFEELKKNSSRRDDEASIFVFNSKDDRYDRVDAEEMNKPENLKELVGRMGKFVVKNNKIVYAEIMDPAETPDFMVVMENKDGQLKGINGETSDFKKDLRDDKDYDYSLVYNTKGEKLSLKDIKEGNVVYVQQHKYDGDDVANVVVVQDNKFEGEMGRVKVDRAEVAGKERKVVLTKDEKGVADYKASYAVVDLDEVKRWNADSDWEDDMEDAYKENIVAYTDAVGRIAFLTTEGGNSGYKFGIVTRTYADADRVRIFTTIDGKEGKDQIFKADKEIDIESPFLLDSKGLETKDRFKGERNELIGKAVKFRLNSDGEITKDKLFVMPVENVYGMTDDFGKDIIKAVKVDTTDTDAFKNFKPKDKAGQTFAVNSDSTVAIDAPKVGIKDVKVSNLDDEDMGFGKIDVDDFNVTTWKGMKEDKQDDESRFYIFPKTNKEFEVDGLVFIGKDGANTGSDEEAVYVIDQWKKGDKLFVEYVKYPENKKETREVDNEDRLTLEEKEVKKETAYVGKEKSNGKIALYGKLKADEKTEDFKVYRNKTVTSVKGNYIKVAGVDQEFLITGSLVYDEDKSKTSSYVKKDMVIDVVSDGIRARVIGVIDNAGKAEDTTDTKDIVYIQGAYQTKGDYYVRLSDTKDGKIKTYEASEEAYDIAVVKANKGKKAKAIYDGDIVVDLIIEDEKPVDPVDPTEPAEKTINGELSIRSGSYRLDVVAKDVKGGFEAIEKVTIDGKETKDIFDNGAKFAVVLGFEQDVEVKVYTEDTVYTVKFDKIEVEKTKAELTAVKQQASETVLFLSVEANEVKGTVEKVTVNGTETENYKASGTKFRVNVGSFADEVVIETSTHIYTVVVK